MAWVACGWCHAENDIGSLSCCECGKDPVSAPPGPAAPKTPMDRFLEEIDLVCKKHGFSISHEDGHGAFIIEKYDGDSGISGARKGTSL